MGRQRRRFRIAAVAAMAAACSGAAAADTLDDLFYRALKSARRVSRALAGPKPVDVDRAIGTATDEARTLDDLTERVRRLPPFTDGGRRRRRGAERHVRRRGGGRAQGGCVARRPARPPRGEARRRRRGGRCRPGAVLHRRPRPVRAGHVPGREGRPRLFATDAVQLRGVRDQAFPLDRDVRLAAVVDHLTQGIPPTTLTLGDDGFDPTITYVGINPMADLDAMAARVDFGRPACSRRSAPC